MKISSLDINFQSNPELTTNRSSLYNFKLMILKKCSYNEGTCKVQNKIEMKRNKKGKLPKQNRNETKIKRNQNETKRHLQKRNKIKSSKMKPSH